MAAIVVADDFISVAAVEHRQVRDLVLNGANTDEKGSGITFDRPFRCIHDIDLHLVPAGKPAACPVRKLSRPLLIPPRAMVTIT